MATKTFSSGDVLTAADTNTYLSNSGLVFVTDSTFSGVASVAIDNCFTSTFFNYRVVLAITTGAGGPAQIQFQMRAGGTPTAGSSYFGYYRGITWTGGNDVTANNGGSNWFLMRTNGAQWAGGIDFENPQTASNTFVQSLGCDTSQTWNAGGYHNSSTQFDGFSFSNSGSSTMAGTVKVYGYRQS